MSLDLELGKNNENILGSLSGRCWGELYEAVEDIEPECRIYLWRRDTKITLCSTLVLIRSITEPTLMRPLKLIICCRINKILGAIHSQVNPTPRMFLTRSYDNHASRNRVVAVRLATLIVSETRRCRLLWPTLYFRHDLYISDVKWIAASYGV